MKANVNLFFFPLTSLNLIMINLSDVYEMFIFESTYWVFVLYFASLNACHSLMHDPIFFSFQVYVDKTWTFYTPCRFDWNPSTTCPGALLKKCVYFFIRIWAFLTCAETSCQTLIRLFIVDIHKKCIVIFTFVILCISCLIWVFWRCNSWKNTFLGVV